MQDDQAIRLTGIDELLLVSRWLLAPVRELLLGSIMALIMKPINLQYFALAGIMALAALAALPGHAQLPKRDLIVQVREVNVGEGGAYSVGTQVDKALLAPQQLRVRNGEKASLSVGRSMPVQRVESASVVNLSLSTSSGPSASSSSASVTNAVKWMDAGQEIKLQAQWPGARQPVKVALEIESASVQGQTGADLPAQSSSRFATTVSAPLGQWVSIAFTGPSRQSGVYGSEPGSDPRRVLQIRVLAP